MIHHILCVPIDLEQPVPLSVSLSFLLEWEERSHFVPSTKNEVSEAKDSECSKLFPNRMATTNLFYMCTFSLGNFTYLYRCRILDQYCCGHTCCFKQPPSDTFEIFSSWYFWSLILVVLIVFGCIVVSFALTSLKQRHDIQSWSLIAGSAFSNLATTVTGAQGIIKPQLHYRKKTRKVSNQESQNARQRRSSEMPSISSSVDTQRSNFLSSRNAHADPEKPHEWVEIQLTPLSPPYKSNWTGNSSEIRLAASTQVLFPPGFINS